MEITKDKIIKLGNSLIDSGEYEYVNIEDTCLEYCTNTESFRNTIITYPEDINYEELVEFNGIDVHKDKFFKLMKKYIPPEQLIGCQGIVFITNEDDLDTVYEDCGDVDIEEKAGLFCYEESICLVNVMQIRNVLEDDSLYYTDFNRELSIGIWTTLIHEVRHSLCECSILGDLLPEKAYEEEEVEKYCLGVFKNMELNDDYLCFIV